MTFSQKRHKQHDELAFPIPPIWLTWTEEWKGGDSGVLRHHADLQGAKKHLSGFGYDGHWHCSWSVYVWTGDLATGRYVEEYSAKKGDPRADSPLFKKRLKKQVAYRDAHEEDVEAAMASIYSTISASKEKS